VLETVGIEFVSREGFNNNDAARCRNKICLNGGGHPKLFAGFQIIDIEEPRPKILGKHLRLHQRLSKLFGITILFVRFSYWNLRKK
jgi:hypothetical protein